MLTLISGEQSLSSHIDVRYDPNGYLCTPAVRRKRTSRRPRHKARSFFAHCTKRCVGCITSCRLVHAQSMSDVRSTLEVQLLGSKLLFRRLVLFATE